MQICTLHTYADRCRTTSAYVCRSVPYIRMQRVAACIRIRMQMPHYICIRMQVCTLHTYADAALPLHTYADAVLPLHTYAGMYLTYVCIRMPHYLCIRMQRITSQYVAGIHLGLVSSIEV
jgi:hypothetical protein